MELKAQALSLKTQLANSIEIWASGRIDAFALSNPAVKPAAKYLKRGVHNLIVQHDQKIIEKVEGAMLFLADENGHYDKEMLFDDAMDFFNTMKPYPFDLGFIQGTFGNGSILLELPDNLLTNMMLGGDNAIRITAADFQELKAIFTK